MKKLNLISILVLASSVSFSTFAEIPVTAKYKTNKQSLPPINNFTWTSQEFKAEALEGKLLKTLEKKTDDKVALSNLATLYLLNNKITKAIEAYQNAINNDPKNAKLFAGLSIAYLHHSRYKMAQAMANEALALDPKMKHATKIKEYIAQKKAVIAQASKISAVPEDSTHTTINNKMH